MPATKPFGFHEGSRSGYLAQYAVVSWGTAVVISQQEDHGNDLHCILMDRIGRWLFKGCGVFAIALVFRTVDVPICHLARTSTHFLWHIGLAAALYLLARVACERRTRWRAENIRSSATVLAVLIASAVLVTAAVFPGEEPTQLPQEQSAVVE
jgi:hypothetical protein